MDVLFLRGKVESMFCLRTRMSQISKPTLLTTAIFTSAIVSIVWCSEAQTMFSSIDIATLLKTFGGEALLLMVALIGYLTGMFYKPKNETVGFILEKVLLTTATICITSYFILAYHGWDILTF